MNEGHKELLRQVQELLQASERRMTARYGRFDGAIDSCLTMGGTASSSSTSAGSDVCCVAEVPAPASFIPDANLAVAIDVEDLVTPTPARCSMEGPSRDSTELRSASALATAPTTPTATVDTHGHPRPPTAPTVLVASLPPAPTEYVLDTNSVHVAVVPLAVPDVFPAVSTPAAPTVQLQQLCNDNGDETRPQPWPSFGKVNSAISTKTASNDDDGERGAAVDGNSVNAISFSVVPFLSITAGTHINCTPPSTASNRCSTYCAAAVPLPTSPPEASFKLQVASRPLRRPPDLEAASDQNCVSAPLSIPWPLFACDGGPVQRESCSPSEDRAPLSILSMIIGKSSTSHGYLIGNVLCSSCAIWYWDIVFQWFQRYLSVIHCVQQANENFEVSPGPEQPITLILLNVLVIVPLTSASPIDDDPSFLRTHIVEEEVQRAPYLCEIIQGKAIWFTVDTGGHSLRILYQVEQPSSCNMFLSEAKPPMDTWGILMDHHSRPGFGILGVLVTWPHVSMVKIIGLVPQISLNVQSTISLAGSGSLDWGAHQAVFCNAFYNKKAWKLAVDICLMGQVREENSVTWLLVVWSRLDTSSCSIISFTSNGRPSRVIVVLLNSCGEPRIGYLWQGSIHAEVTFWLDYSFIRVNKRPQVRQSPHTHCSTGLQIVISVMRYLLCQLFLVRVPLMYWLDKLLLPTWPRPNAYFFITHTMFGDPYLSSLIICKVWRQNQYGIIIQISGLPGVKFCGVLLERISEPSAVFSQNTVQMQIGWPPRAQVGFITIKSGMPWLLVEIRLPSSLTCVSRWDVFVPASICTQQSLQGEINIGVYDSYYQDQVCTDHDYQLDFFRDLGGAKKCPLSWDPGGRHMTGLDRHIVLRLPWDPGIAAAAWGQAAFQGGRGVRGPSYALPWARPGPWLWAWPTTGNQQHGLQIQKAPQRRGHPDGSRRKRLCLSSSLLLYSPSLLSVLPQSLAETLHLATSKLSLHIVLLLPWNPGGTIIAWSLVDLFCARSDFESSGIDTIKGLSSWNCQYCFEPIQSEIGWSFHSEYSASGKQFAQPLFANSVQPCTPGAVSFPGSEQVQWGSAHVTIKDLLLLNMADCVALFNPKETLDQWWVLNCHSKSNEAFSFAEKDHSSPNINYNNRPITEIEIQLQWNTGDCFALDDVCLGPGIDTTQVTWDPGGWTFAPPTYCCDHYFDHTFYFDQVCADQDYYLDVFCDQVRIGHDYYLGVFLEKVGTVSYLNLVKVCLNYGTQRDLGEVMKHQVPWDPGGSTWYRLEVKPKFKEGGMLATSLLSSGLGHGLLGLGCSEATRCSDYKYQCKWIRTGGLDRDGFGLHSSCLLLPPEFLFSFLFKC